MITVFENYFNGHNIKDYVVDGNKIPDVSFYYFGWNNINKKYLKPLNYNYLMRFCTYFFFLNYKGNEPTIKFYLEGLKSKDDEKIRIINQFGNSNLTRNYIKDNILPELKCNDYNCNNQEDMNLFIDNYRKIFTEKNVFNFISIIAEVTEKATKAENIAKNFLSNLMYKHSYVQKAEGADDLHGVDLWKINKETGQKESIQVKNISNLKMIDNVIFINSKNVDLKDFNGYPDKLKFDYLALYSIADSKLYYIKSNAILKIYKVDNKFGGKSIKIIIGRWALNDRFSFSIFDIGPKYTGVDTSRVFIE